MTMTKNTPQAERPSRPTRAQQRERALRLAAATALTKGGTYAHETKHGSGVKIFYVAGGSFCRVDTRRGGALVAELSGTFMMTDVAMNMFVRAVAELDA